MLENTQGNAENINKNVNQDIKLRVQDEDTQQMTDHMADPSSYYNYRLQQNSTSFSSDPYCFRHRQSIVILAAFAITYIVVFFPLCILILYQGLKKWMKNPGLSSASVSHSDCFTYHSVTMELIGVFGFILCSCSIYKKMVDIAAIGILVFFFKWYGEVFFHILTCLERYLAVVHPITYLSLKSKRGTRIRNITIASVWLLCLVWTYLCKITKMIIWDLCYLIFALIVISFCCISVLCVLIQPGPGGQGKDRRRVDESKRRAFITIVSILGVLVLRVASNVIWELVMISTGLIECVMMAFTFWLNLPSSLVLPALFLYREFFSKA
ncbi:uncharacterized protein LOC110367370 isoform X1 [Fundulus heteroclitus]|uniref:uncharacterized protein LOC110367370 isoform X1 n=1 Tax=Fundulus heteroclitus TaxID=8078 RepID=UPI00165AA271|nr:uncharacterized protein LOC110367370 isoform X1 [Fundulus heteroclitus]